MSKINVDTWEPESGTAATLMASGDTVTLPNGAILAVASGGDINVASGGEIDIASGATLDVNGTIDLTGATTTGFPAGGLTHASQWRLTTSFTGAADPITTNLAEVVAPVGFGVLGASMTESSGIFTFPVTGYWLIAYGSIRHNSGRISRMEGTIKTTTDNATYANAAMAYTFTVSAPTTYTSSFCQYIFDVTDTTTHKCAFQSGCASGSPTTAGAAVAWEATNMTFIRLADT